MILLWVSVQDPDLRLDCVPNSEHEVMVSITPESTDEMVLRPRLVPVPEVISKLLEPTNPHLVRWQHIAEGRISLVLVNLWLKTM